MSSRWKDKQVQLLVPVVILTRVPDAFGEPWPTLVRGDVGLVAGLVAVLGLATLAARALFAYRRSAISPDAPVGDTASLVVTTVKDYPTEFSAGMAPSGPAHHSRRS